MPGLFIYRDNSNIFIGAQAAAVEREGETMRGPARPYPNGAAPPLSKAVPIARPSTDCKPDKAPLRPVKRVLTRILSCIAFGAAVASSPPAWADWTVTERVHEMDGYVIRIARSDATRSTRTLPFPYGRVRAQLAVQCERSNLSVGTFFSTLHFQNSLETIHNLRVKFDNDDPIKWTVWNNLSSDQFQLVSDVKSNIERIMNAQTMLMEVPWHGAGDAYFEFSLTGSKTAVYRLGCRIPESLHEEENLAGSTSGDGTSGDTHGDDPTRLLNTPPAPPRPTAAPGPSHDAAAIGDYGSSLHRTLNRAAARSYPRHSMDRGEEGAVPLLLRIAPDGELLEVRVLDDSQASRTLVTAAVRTAQRSSPFTDLAAGMGDAAIEFRITINYRLR